MEQNLIQRLRGIRHVALDMDGTLYLSDTLFPFTPDFLNTLSSLGIGWSYLTNNPSKSLADYEAKLARMGLPCAPGQMYTTAVAMIDYLKAHFPGKRRLFILGTPSMTEQFVRAGFISCADDPDDVPDAVVAAFDMSLTYPRLCRSAWWIKQGLPYLATNPDRVCPTDARTVLVDCGSICRCLESATGRQPDVTLGKPDPEMLSGIRRRHNLAPGEIAMVGDRLYTDLEMARRAGALGVLVLSGETRPEEVPEGEGRPDIVCENVAAFGALLRQADGR